MGAKCATTSPSRSALELIAIYHLAKAADVLAHYIIEPPQFLPRLKSQVSLRRFYE